MKTKNDFIESWLNGNKLQIRKLMKNKSKKFAFDLIDILVKESRYTYKEAVLFVQEMCK